MEATNPNQSYGKKITLEEVNAMIKTQQRLSSLSETKIIKKPGAAPNAEDEKMAEVMIGKKHNAFVFSKELIQRFFDGSAGKTADYLMVLLGAHPEPKNGFEAGSFTVLAVGCNKKIEVDKDGNETETFYALDIEDPGTEYPPSSEVTELNPQ